MDVALFRAQILEETPDSNPNLNPSLPKTHQVSIPRDNPLLLHLVDLTLALLPPFKSSDSDCSGNLADLSCGYLFHHSGIIFQ